MMKQKIKIIFEDWGTIFAKVSTGKEYAYFIVDEDKLSKKYTEYDEKRDWLELCNEIEKQINEQKFDVSKLPSINKLSPAMKEAMNWLFDAEETSIVIYDEDSGDCPWRGINMSKEEFQKQIMSDIEKYDLYDDITDCKDSPYPVFLIFNGSMLSRFSKPII